MAKNEGRSPMKVFFSPPEGQLVKLAAVSQGTTASEFARQATLKAAAQAMENFKLPTLEASSPTPRKKKST